MTGFYEWQKRKDGKQPYRFRRKDVEPFAFAEVWEFAQLGGEDILSTGDRWRSKPTCRRRIDDLRAMLKPYDPALMEAYAVNRAVNGVKNDTEECIEPAADVAS